MRSVILSALILSLSASLHAAVGKAPEGQLMDAAKWSLVMSRDDDALWAAREALKLQPDLEPARELVAKLEIYTDTKRLAKAADEGDAGAMLRMGDRALDGKDGKPDREKALQWYRKSAEAGEARALWRVGVMLSRGEGTERNVADAAACFQAAARAGDPWAKYSLSAAHLSGQGVERDIKEAGRLLREAAEAGIPQAMREVAWISEQMQSPAAKREAAFWKGRLKMTVERMAKLLPGSPHVANDLAEVLVGEGEIDKAVEVLKDAAGRIDDPLLHERLAEVLLRQKKADEAIGVLKAQLEKKPDNTRLRLVLVRCLMFKKDYRGALGEADRIIKQDAAMAAAHYYRGQILDALDDKDGAIKALRKACELSPDAALMRVMLANTLERAKRQEEAIQEYEKLTSVPAQRALAYEGLARIRIVQKNWAEAERVLDRAEQAMPKEAHWPSMRAQLWLRRDDAGKAVVAAKKAAELAPGNNAVQALYLDLLLKQKDGADQVLRESDSAADGPEAWRIVVMRGMARAQLKQADLAAAEFDRAMYLVDVAKDDMAAEVVASQMVEAIGGERTAQRIGSRKPERWLLALAVARLDHRDWPAAVKTAEELMDVADSEQPESLRRRALWYASQLYGGAAETLPTLDKAEQAYLKYIELVADDPDMRESRITALNNLAFMLVDHPTKPDAKKALKYSQQAWDQMGKDDAYRAFVADTQGWVLVQLGRVDEGIAVLKDAVDRGEKSAEMSYHLGDAYLRKGKIKEALAELEKARELLKEEKRVSPLVGKRIEAAIEKAKSRAAASTRPASRP